MDGRGDYAQRAVGLIYSAKDRARKAAEEGSQRLSQMRAKAQGLMASAGGACVAGAGRHSIGSEEEKIVRLMALGFSQPAVNHALWRCGGDLEAAAAWLLDTVNTDERLAAEEQAGEDSPQERAPAGPFIAPSALRPAGSEFAALSALRPKGRDSVGAAPVGSAPAGFDQALRARLRELLPDDGPGLEECLAALPREELQEVAACLEADRAECHSRGAPPSVWGAAPLGAGGPPTLSALGAVSEWRGAQDGEEFFIRLENDGDRSPGMVLDPRSLAVVDITFGSLLADWNGANPGCVVRLSDVVWEVNGISDPEQIVARLGRRPGSGEALMVGLRRPTAPKAVAAFRGSCSPASGADFLLPQALRSQLAPEGAGPLRQWVPPVARAAGSGQGDDAGLEDGISDRTAHFGRVDAAELAERLRMDAAGQEVGAGVAEDSAAAVPVTVGQLLPAEALTVPGAGPSAQPASEDSTPRPGAAEAEPEAEETLADAALFSAALSREVEERAEPESPPGETAVRSEGWAVAPEAEEDAEPEAAPCEAVARAESGAAAPEEPPASAGPAVGVAEVPAEGAAPAAAATAPADEAPTAGTAAPAPAAAGAVVEDSVGQVAAAESAPKAAAVGSHEEKPVPAEVSVEDVIVEELPLSEVRHDAADKSPLTGLSEDPHR